MQDSSHAAHAVARAQWAKHTIPRWPEPILWRVWQVGVSMVGQGRVQQSHTSTKHSYAFYNHAISMYMVPVGMGNSRCLARSPQALADRIIMVDEIETPYLQGIAGPIWMCRTPTGRKPWLHAPAVAPNESTTVQAQIPPCCTGLSHTPRRCTPACFA